MKKKGSLLFLFDNKEYLALFSLFILALFLRGYHFQERIQWYGDSSRDLMVSKHMAFSPQNDIYVGHTASGFSQFVSGGDVIHYPLVYYYYLALLWRLLQDLNNIFIFNIIIQSLSVLPAYLLGKELSTRTGGLIAALCIAISEQMVGLSSVIVGLHVSVPFVLFSCVFSVQGIIQRSERKFLFGQMLLILFSTFNYAVIPIWGVLFLTKFIVSFKNNRSFWIETFILTLINISFFLFLHFRVIQFYGLDWFKVVFHVFSSNSTKAFNFHFERISYLISQLFPLYSQLIFVLSILLTIATNLYQSSKKITAIIATFLFYLGFHFVFAITKQGIYIDTYLFYMQAIYIIFISTLFGISLDKIRHSFAKSYKRGQKKLLIFFFLSMVIIFYLFIYSMSRNFLYLYSHDNDFEKDKLFAEYLIHRYGDPKSFSVVESSDFDFHWESPTIWYWIEELSGENLYKITNLTLGLDRSSESFSKVIFICKRFEDPRMDEISCHENIKLSVGYIFNKYKQVGESYSYGRYQISEFVENTE